MKDWTYNGLYKKFNMEGDIVIGTGIVRVHDIFQPLPDFMKDADFIISDPPYNKSALSSFYTKAGIEKKPDSFDALIKRFFEIVDEISPWGIMLEIGIDKADIFVPELESRFKNIFSFESYYYGNKKQKCLIVFASNKDIPESIKNIPFVDEEKVIEYVIKNIGFKCVADPFMGLGLVGFYADKCGKKFVGTELNKYRLSVCLERITTGERGKIN